jgi:hypothetical protein
VTSSTTWKNRGIRAAFALFAVAVLALWLLFYSVATAFAKEYLQSPWDGIVQWGLLAVVVFLCFYFPGSPGGRQRRKSQVHFQSREPTPSDRAPKNDLWYALDHDGYVRAAFIQTGRRRNPKWMPHHNGYAGGRVVRDDAQQTLIQYRQTRGRA